MKKVKFSIRNKLLFYVLLTTIVVYVTIFGIVTMKLRKIALQGSYELIETRSREEAAKISGKINREFNIVRTLAQTFQGIEYVPQSNRNEVYKNMLKNIALNNPDLLAIWTSWELSVWDSSWIYPYGRLRMTYYNENNRFVYLEDELDQTGDNYNGIYYKLKTSGKEALTEPYLFSYNNDDENQILETSICVPIMINGQFAGLTGTDVSIYNLAEQFYVNQSLDTKHVILLTNDGSVMVYPDKSNVGINYRQIMEFSDSVDYLKGSPEDIIKNMDSGGSYTVVTRDRKSLQKWYTTFIPVQAGESETHWLLGLIIPYHELVQQANSITLIAIIYGLLGLIFITFMVLKVSGMISHPIKQINDDLIKLSTGNLSMAGKINIESGDEIEIMASNLNRLTKGILDKAQFTNALQSGQLDSKLELLSEDDQLGLNLMQMQESLKKSKNEEEQRKEADRKTNWTNEGLTGFGEILRQNTNDMKEFSYHLISNLIKYSGTEAGGLFILNDIDPNDKHLELLAAFAYDRRKFIDFRVEVNEGLLGASFMEKKSYHLTDLPEEYMSITSGTGETKPDNVIIVPLVHDNISLGVIEIASIRKIEPHVAEFIHKVAEITASTMSTVRTNIRTNELLEKSQQQAEELQAQEEEMRQNLEELQATHEEMTRREQLQSEEIKKLNTENETKIKEIEKMQAEVLEQNQVQLGKFEETTSLYENEINDMYDTWWKHLERMEKIIFTGKKK